MAEIVTADLWKAFGDRVRRFIGKRVASDADADDVLQEVFSKIHAGLDKVGSPAKLEAWVFQIARRAIADHFRRRRFAGVLPDVAEDVPPETVTAEVSSWLEPMMESLPAEDREALRLADVEGLPRKELAARLGISLPGAKSRVQRARRRLKETLLECCDVEMDRRGNALSYTPRRCNC